MNVALLKKYAPFYVSLTVTAVVMVFLFLRPGPALGLTLDTEANVKFPGFTAGFALDEFATVNSTFNLEGAFEPISRVTVTITRLSGTGGFTDFTFNAPLPVAPDYDPVIDSDQSSQAPQGNLKVGSSFDEDVRELDFGYGYGYLGELGAGIITVTTRYRGGVPGTYQVAVRAISAAGAVLVEDSTTYKVLDPLVAANVTILGVIGTRGPDILVGDTVILPFDIDASLVPNLVSVEFDTDVLNPNRIHEADGTGEYHPVIPDTYDVPAAATHIGVFRIQPAVSPIVGHFAVNSIITDIAGQVVNISGANAHQVLVEATRSTFTFSSVDGLNFIAAPLQCVAGAPACSGDGGFAFDIATVLNQEAVNAAAGFALMSDAAEILWVYCAQGSTDCPGTGTIPGFSAFVPGGISDVDFLPFGIGAILKIKDAAVRTLTDATDSQFPGPLPVAVRFSVSGDINPLAPPSSPDPEKVYPGFNLEGLTSERDVTVGNIVTGVRFPTRRDLQLFVFNNGVGFLLDANGGQVHDAQGKPLIFHYQGLLESLFNDGDAVSVGSSFWLEMCDTGTPAECTGQIGPVLAGP